MNYNKLTDAQTERLANLVEECGEVIQAAGKILRHGYETDYNGVHYDNLAQLETELGDVWAMLSLLIDAGDVKPFSVTQAAQRKREEFRKWSHHQGE